MTVALASAWQPSHASRYSVRLRFRLAPATLDTLRPSCLRVAAPRVARQGEAWWACLDSNQEPDRYERPALTIELQARERRAGDTRRCRYPLQCGVMRGNTPRRLACAASPTERRSQRLAARR